MNPYKNDAMSPASASLSDYYPIEEIRRDIWERHNPYTKVLVVKSVSPYDTSSTTVNILSSPSLSTNSTESVGVSTSHSTSTSTASATPPTAPPLSSDTIPTKFTLFPKLPLELRQVIWGLASSEGRSVDFSSEKRYTSGTPFEGTDPFQGPLKGKLEREVQRRVNPTIWRSSSSRFLDASGSQSPSSDGETVNSKQTLGKGRSAKSPKIKNRGCPSTAGENSIEGPSLKPGIFNGKGKAAKSKLQKKTGALAKTGQSSRSASENSTTTPPNARRSKRVAARLVKTMMVSKNLPAILQASQESREVALKHYTLCLGPARGGKHIYINFDRDILHFDDREALLVLCGIDQPHMYSPRHLIPVVKFPAQKNIVEEKLRFLIIDAHLCNKNIPALARFGNLESLTSRKKIIGSGFYFSETKYTTFYKDISIMEKKLKELWKIDDENRRGSSMPNKIPEFKYETTDGTPEHA